MLRLAIIALAGAAAVYAQAVFEGGAWFGEEDLEGRPKTVKIEREKLGDASILQPEEEWEYSANGNPLAHRQFAGGKLVANHAIITLYADRRAIKQKCRCCQYPSASRPAGAVLTQKYRDASGRNRAYANIANMAACTASSKHEWNALTMTWYAIQARAAHRAQFLPISIYVPQTIAAKRTTEIHTSSECAERCALKSARW